MNSASDLIYVIHGSNAHSWWRRLANGGYPWWRRWSLFSCALRAGFDDDCEIREFRWSGGNTHQARLDAGNDLARVIEKEPAGRRIHLVGHSHGGNVALAAVNRLPDQRVASVVLLASPHMALIDSKGQPPQWLYWDAAHERAGHIWNIYSPEDFVQGKLAEWFHGIPRGRRALLTRQRYSGTEQKPVKNVEIRWQRRLSAHRNLHSDSIGLCVGALLRGATIPEAMETAGLSMVALNKDRPRGGWPGIERTFKTLQMLSDPRPFDLGDSTNRVGILFVHGFTASPSEMRPMAQFVSDSKGWRCSAVLLPGHGTRVQDMQNADADDWVDAVQRAYEAMARRCDDVLLVGLSLGAVLCCHAALRQSQNSKLRGLLLLAPAFAVTRSRALGLKLLRPFHNLASKGKRASDYFLDNRLYTYLQLPLNLAVQVMQLGQKAAASMGKLRAIPVMMFVGDRESTVSLEKVLSVARENPWIRLVRLQHSRHILTVEPDQQILFETSVRFMEECLSGGTSPEAEKSIS